MPARCSALRWPPRARLDSRLAPAGGNSIRMRQTRPSPTICTSPEVLDSRFRIIGPAPVSSAALNEPIRDGLFAPPLVVMTRAVSRGLRADGLATEAAPKARAASWAVVRAAGLVRACRSGRLAERRAPIPGLRLHRRGRLHALAGVGEDRRPVGDIARPGQATSWRRHHRRGRDHQAGPVAGTWRRVMGRCRRSVGLPGV
jgi:hypothetical protein